MAKMPMSAIVGTFLPFLACNKHHTITKFFYLIEKVQSFNLVGHMSTIIGFRNEVFTFKIEV